MNQLKFILAMLAYKLRSNRTKWLFQHFGREGARRWLLNDRKKQEYRRQEQAKVNLSKPTWNPLLRLCRLMEYRLASRACQRRLQADPEACQAVFLGQDGKVHGLAMQRFGLKDRKANPPWGSAGRSYSFAHHPNPRCRKAIDGRHGEPSGEDWMGAGFWQKGLEAAKLDAMGSRNGIGLFDDEGKSD